jgi:hypothetical protein
MQIAITIMEQMTKARPRTNSEKNEKNYFCSFQNVPLKMIFGCNEMG